MVASNRMSTFASRLSPAHQREMDNYARCPYRWFLDFQARERCGAGALGVARRGKWLQAISLRRTIADLHSSGNWADFESFYSTHWKELVAAYGEALHACGGDEEALCQEALSILAGYCARPDNRRSHVVCSNASFLVKIGRYWFRGTVDQVRKITTSECQSFSGYQIVHFGTSRRPPQRVLDNGYGYRIAAVAMVQGSFFVRTRTHKTVIRFNRFPQRTTHYQLTDHLPLKRLD